MVLGSFQCRGVLLLLHKVRQGPAVLAAGAGWVAFIFYNFHLSSLSNVLSWETAEYDRNIVVSAVVSYCRGRPRLVLVNRLEGLSVHRNNAAIDRLDMTSLLTGPVKLQHKQTNKQKFLLYQRSNQHVCSGFQSQNHRTKVFQSALPKQISYSFSIHRAVLVRITTTQCWRSSKISSATLISGQTRYE